MSNLQYNNIKDAQITVLQHKKDIQCTVQEHEICQIYSTTT